MTPTTDHAYPSHRSSAVMVFPCRLDSLDDLTQWVQAIGHRNGISDRQIFRLELVLVELTTNIVEHSGMHNAGSPISVSIDFDRDHIWAQIEDCGQPFDPTTAPVKVQPETLEAAPIGGLGLRLIRSYTQHWEYQRTNHTNQLRVKIARDG